MIRQHLINRSAVRAAILNLVREYRPGWNCRKVSERKTLDVLEARLMAMLVQEVKTHPTLGRTFILSAGRS